MITSDSFNTPRFANINDADYALNTEQDLHDSVGITDVTLSLMIADFSNIARDVMYPNSSADINREVQQQEVTIRVNEFHDRIEQVYLNGCTGNDPGTWSHRMIARLFVLRLAMVIQCTTPITVGASTYGPVKEG